jgi:Sec-independent protein translocase protein TatA
MGKAIKNFKDSISGIEEASYKRIHETGKPETRTSDAPASADAAKKPESTPQTS